LGATAEEVPSGDSPKVTRRGMKLMLALMRDSLVSRKAWYPWLQSLALNI